MASNERRHDGNDVKGNPWQNQKYRQNASGKFARWWRVAGGPMGGEVGQGGDLVWEARGQEVCNMAAEEREFRTMGTGGRGRKWTTLLRHDVVISDLCIYQR